MNSIAYKACVNFLTAAATQFRHAEFSNVPAFAINHRSLPPAGNAMINEIAAVDFLPEQVVYFIGPASGPVKIGLTNDVERRRAFLQTGNHESLMILAVVPGDRSVELSYHMRFRHLRIIGEWFARTSEIEVEMERLNELYREVTAVISRPVLNLASLPPLTQHPGNWLREVILPEWGLSISEVARLIDVNRSNLSNVMSGKADVSRELAYRLGALFNDHVSDLLIAYQHAWDIEQERGRRDELKGQIQRLPEPA